MHQQTGYELFAMSLRAYIVTLCAITALCVTSLIVTIQYVNPDTAGVFGLILFYLSFGLSVVGVASLIGLYLRILFSNNEILFAHIVPSFRQGVFVAATATTVLLLQGFRLLKWWDAILVVIIIGMTEFFFHSKDLRRKRGMRRDPASMQETTDDRSMGSGQ